MPNLIKDEFVDLLQMINYDRTKEKITKKELSGLYDDFFKVIEISLLDGYNIPFPNIGGLKIVERNARKGRNPKTGEEVDIPPRKDVKVRLNDKFKEKLNS